MSGDTTGDIKKNIVDAIATNPKLIDELFSGDSEITNEKLVKALQEQNHRIIAVGTSILTLNKNLKNFNEQVKTTSSRVQKLYDIVQELKQSNQSLAQQRQFSSGNVDEEEIMRKIIEKVGEPDEALIRGLKKEQRKFLKQVSFIAISSILILSSLVAINTLGYERFISFFAKKEFSNPSSYTATPQQKITKKVNNSNSKPSAPIFYLIPKKAPFSCEGVQGEYTMPQAKEITGRVKNGVLHYKIENKGKKYNCSTRKFSRKK